MLRIFRDALLLSCAALVSALMFAATGAGAATFVPNRFDDPSVGGTNCTPPAPDDGCSLRGAVAAAQNGDTVELGAGTYVLSLGQLQVPNAITIAGAGPGVTTIEQTARDRVIEADSGLTLVGVTITGGDLVGSAGADGTHASPQGLPGGDVEGGGIEGGDAPLTLSNVVVTGNRAVAGNGGDGAAGAAGPGGTGGSAGGGGIIGGDPLTLTNVEIIDNVARGGAGGTGSESDGFSAGGAGGSAGQAAGGGIDQAALSLTVTDSLIAGNSAISGPGGAGGAGGSSTGLPGDGGQGEPGLGGGLFSEGAAALTNVTFTGDVASGSPGGVGGKSASPDIAGGDGGLGIGGDGGAVVLAGGASARFASDTIASNTAGRGVGGAGGAGDGGGVAGAIGGSDATGGGDLYVAFGTAALRDSIIANGHGDSGTQNCTIANGVIASFGHNLDDRDQCFVAHGAGDLFGVKAGLSPLQVNGGPTPTLALATKSAAIHHGEAHCVDALGLPLTVDQRGARRHSPCDIGAFEGQPPSHGKAPKLSGRAVTGQRLTCMFATYAGDQPQTNTVQWLRGGAVIAGATGKQYLVKAGDTGRRLACRQIVTNPYGTARNRSKAIKAVAEKLSGLELGSTPLQNGLETTISFSLNAGAKVSFALARIGPGGRRTPVRGAPAAVKARKGPTVATWTPQALAPGTYALTATPAGGAGKTIDFVLSG